MASFFQRSRRHMALVAATSLLAGGVAYGVQTPQASAGDNQFGTGMGVLGGALLGSLAGKRKNRAQNALIGGVVGGFLGNALSRQSETYSQPAYPDYDHQTRYRSNTWQNPNRGATRVGYRPNTWQDPNRGAARVVYKPKPVVDTSNCQEAEYQITQNRQVITQTGFACQQDDGRWVLVNRGDVAPRIAPVVRASR